MNTMLPKEKYVNTQLPQPPADARTAEQCAAVLSAHPDYRVLRRLDVVPAIAPADPRFPLRACIVDTEATGLDTATDTPIDIGMVLFSHDAAGNIGPILAAYSGLQDPGRPLPPEITALTGYRDEDLAGKSFDIARIEHLLLQSDLVIAHSAAYDRKMYERITPVAQTRAWGCSAVDVDWRANGFGSFKLDYLVYSMGLFFDGHTALADSMATLAVLGVPFCNKGPHANPLASLLHVAAHPKIRLGAVNSPFSSKDLLKGRAYKWFPAPPPQKGWWWKDVDAAAVDAEIDWLTHNVYGQDARTRARMEPLDPKDRFSVRTL